MSLKSPEHRRSLWRTLLFLLAASVLSANAQAQESTPKIVVFGDSLSAAYRIPVEKGWVTLLAQRIEQAGLNYTVVNASISGETTDGGLSRLPATLATHKPEILILELGGNDGLRGLPISNIRQNLEEMVTMGQASGALVVLAGIQIPPNYGPRYTEPFTRQFEEIASAMSLPFVPFLIDGIAQNPALMQEDGIHPVAEAQEMVLDNVWPVLAPLLNEPKS